MKTNTKTLTMIALVTAMICIAAPISIPVPFSPVPLTLCTFVLYLAAYILGAKYATIATAIYLLIGFIGVPVFSGYTAGIQKLAGASGGYLIGFLFVSLISGFFIDRYPNRKGIQILGMFLASVVNYSLGTFQMSRVMGTSFWATLPAGCFIYLPLDIVKIFVACWLGAQLKPYLKRVTA